MTPTRRRVLFAGAAIVIAVVASVAAFFALDLYVHTRAERSAGVNVWGYRGPIAPRKAPGEVRVVMLGGSTVFGYGLTWDEALPAQLEQRLQRAGARTPFSVVNLGYNNEGAYSFRFTLEDFAYLQPDIVCLYEGYNDLMGDGNGGNPTIYRHSSPLFRATGYFPLLPLVLHEKALALRYGGNLNAAYAAEDKTVFQPTLAARATSGALDAAATIGNSLERQLARVNGAAQAPPARSASTGCSYPWTMYCRDVAAAIDYALSREWRVVFVAQPHLATPRARERHLSQQQAVAALLDQRYGARRDVQRLDLGDTLDVRHATLAFDGMHLTAAGNARIADLLAQPILNATADRQAVR
jgi:lysophospholipase L1-like esterase